MRIPSALVTVPVAAAAVLVANPLAASAAPRLLAAKCPTGRTATSSLSVSPSTVRPKQATHVVASITNCTASPLAIVVTAHLIPPTTCGKPKQQVIGRLTLGAHATRTAKQSSRAPACLGKYVLSWSVTAKGKVVTTSQVTLTVQK